MDMAKNNKCPGCFPEFQLNQLAHMVEGGCLDIDIEEENIQKKKKVKNEKKDAKKREER